MTATFATMNVGRALATKVDATATIFARTGAYIMALQEVDVNVDSAFGDGCLPQAWHLLLLWGT